MDAKYLARFPSVLKSALNTYNMDFPEDTLWRYDPHIAFRGIIRKKDEDIAVKNSDFLSYAELGKNPRGSNFGSEDIEYYSCSCYETKKQLEVAMHLPRPNRRIIKGSIRDTNGCIYINSVTGHIDWWLYDDANPAEDFEVISDE